MFPTRILLVYATVLCVAQGEIDLTFDRAVYDSNPTYIKEFSVSVEENSEEGTFLSVVFEIASELPNDIIGIIALTGCHKGEYIMDLGLNLTGPLCDFINGQDSQFGPNILKVFGINSDPCPPTPGRYTNDHLLLTSIDGLPDQFASGKYEFRLAILTEDEDASSETYLTIADLRLYVEIK